MTTLDYTTKPNWLRLHQGLLEISQHNLFVPKDLGELTTLVDTSGFTRGLKQFLYWKGQLLPSCGKTTVFLAFLGPQGLAHKNVANVLKALRPICNLSLLLETYTGANINFLALSFSEESPILEIVKHFLFYDDCVVLPVVYRGDNTYRFRLLWLPPMFDVARVHHLLSQFSINHRLKRESIGIGDGEYSPTNVVAGVITLKPGMTAIQLPHLIRLPSPHKGSALLLIDGRPPLCLKCREVGHTRRQCTMVRCSTCQMVHFPSSACGASSYSSVAAKGLTLVQDEDWLANLGDESCPDPSISHGPCHDSLAAPASLKSLEDVAMPISISPASNSSVSLSNNTSTMEKCDNITKISTERTLSSEAAPTPSFDEFSSGLFPKGTNLQDLSSVTIIPSFNADITLTSSSHDNLQDSPQLPSPPLTRSRACKKRLVSSSDHLGNSLRSEMVSFTSHSSSSHSKDTSSSFITTHFKPSSDFTTSLDDQMNSSVSDAGETFSDVEVDLSAREVVQDVSSRKRKSAGLVPTDGSSSFDGESHADSPLLVSVPSPSSIVTDDSIVDAIPLLDSPHVYLSDEDKRIASLFSLSSSELASLKAVCPGNNLSAPNIKKLSILQQHSIAIPPVIDHPQFFSLSSSALTKRIKVLEQNQSSFITVPDLLHMGFSYDIIQGLPVFTPTPKLCSDDPFLLKS